MTVTRKTAAHRLFALKQFCLPALAAFAVATSGLAPAASQAATLPDKTLVFCSEGSPAGFDTAQYTTSVEFSAGSRASATTASRSARSASTWSRICVNGSSTQRCRVCTFIR